MQNTLNILDITVLSDDPALVKQVRTACPKIRGAVSYTEKTITNLYKDVVKPTTESYATIALLSQTVATQENVYYMQARFKTVWVQADGTGTADMYQCVNSGAYGIVSSDYASILSALASYPAHSYSRTIFNAAHRGLEGYNENSISGAQAAIAAGATHLELDGKLTTDGEIVLIHDADVERTTDGTGKVEEMSLSEVKNLNLDLYGEEKIPTLGEMIEAIRESDVVLILELKTTNANIVDKLKTVLDEYDFYDRIVVISFHEDLLAKMKTVLPEVATADLKVVKSSTFQSELGSFCARNTIFDNEWDCAWDSERERGWVFNEIFLRDRGIVGWYYTFDSIEDVDKVVKGGFVGITTNVADQYGDRVKFLSPAEQTETDTPAVGNEITLTATSYSGETTQVTGTIFYVEELDDCYAVIASAEVEADYILYTQIFYIAK
jgi:glycerophosphoryl diester phosphodiesterase